MTLSGELRFRGRSQVTSSPAMGGQSVDHEDADEMHVIEERPTLPRVRRVRGSNHSASGASAGQGTPVRRHGVASTFMGSQHRTQPRLRRPIYGLALSEAAGGLRLTNAALPHPPIIRLLRPPDRLARRTTKAIAQSRPHPRFGTRGSERTRAVHAPSQSRLLREPSRPRSRLGPGGTPRRPSSRRMRRARSTVFELTASTAARSLAGGKRSPGEASPAAMAWRISAAT